MARSLGRKLVERQQRRLWHPGRQTPVPRLLNIASQAQLICMRSGSEPPAICVVSRSR
jgi:hypothetical protein